MTLLKYVAICSLSRKHMPVYVCNRFCFDSRVNAFKFIHLIWYINCEKISGVLNSPFTYFYINHHINHSEIDALCYIALNELNHMLILGA